MKKILIVILLASMLLSAVACTGTPVETGTETERETVTLDTPEETETETDPPETEPAETEPPVPDRADVECRAVDEWADVGLSWEGSEAVLLLSLPENWTLESYTPDTYLLFCDGYEIGSVSTTVPKAAEKKVVTEFYENGAYQLDYEVRLVKLGAAYAYRHVFAFFYTTEDEDLRVFLEIDYDQLDAAAARHVAESMAPAGENAKPLRLHLSDKGPCRILLIGNSFISSSQIGSFLTQWLAKEGTYTIQVVSRGYGSVEDFAADEWVNQIRAGAYTAVFMCGFYNENDVMQFPRVMAACHESGTELIMFNAHNETASRVAEARALYSHIPVLDWQGKINALIDSGVDYWMFCINDSHKHSTVLAGYVGAYMIYQALFGEAPPDYTGKAMSMEQARILLPAEFLETGIAPGEHVYEVYTLGEAAVSTGASDKPIPDRDGLKRISVNEWREVGLNLKDSETVIALDIPAEWALRDDMSHTYTITCDDAEVGRVTTRPSTYAERETVRHVDAVGISLDYEICLVEGKKAFEWRHVFTFTSDDGVLCLEVDYAELDEKAVASILSSFERAKLREGNLKLPMAQSNGSNKIFIIGNSFVRTSAVGDFLGDFLKNGKKDMQVVWESVSGAVARGYELSKYLDPIRNGEYSVVFLCGLYYDEDVHVIGTYLDACRQSDTLLVVYPAHNERQPQIDMAKEAYPTVLFMDWKEEINEIIDTGVNFWEFCQDDAWHHSKPPAGYIGAHMIYMALFDEVPPSYTGSQITTQKLRSLIPASYMTSGFTPAERQITVYELCG